MLPFFAAAGHWYYLRFTTIHLIKMTRLPVDLLNKFLKGENAMKNKSGHWNSIYWDMMIKAIVMKMLKARMKRIAFNESLLDCLARRLHISNILECNLKLNLKQCEKKRHPDSCVSINANRTDREKLRNYLVTSINLFYVDKHPRDIAQIHSGKLSNEEINMNSCELIGQKQVK